ncbi:hypothetical protein AB0945_12020 [Streptomyces sp. NPDC005474]|uniref:hypothetical protein n=1 Tax=Streptomyces sp. NPDC005474 TaxID=3154878 RepID=UPI003455128C
MAKEDSARLRNPNIAYRMSLSRSRQRAYDLAMDGGRDAVVLTSRTPSGGTCTRFASLRSIGERREAHYVGELAGNYGRALDTHRRMRRHALTRAEGIVPART